MFLGLISVNPTDVVNMVNLASAFTNASRSN